MSKIGKFLNLKGFHPSNFRNQERVWKKEQEQKAILKRETERQKELRKEQDIMEFNKLQAEVTGKDDSGFDSVRFMYEAPQGMNQEKEEEDLAEDDAVRQFKKKLAEKTLEKQKKDPTFSMHSAQSNLEKSVGRAPKKGLTIGEQMERFPQLKGAPVEGEWTSEVKVTFKPFNEQIKNVRCLRCHEWGHHSGDRECKMRDENPNDEERRLREDPLTFIKQNVRAGAKDLVLRKGALPREMAVEVDGQDILLSSEEDEGNLEKELLESLSKSEKKALLKKLKRMEEGPHSNSSDDSSESDTKGHKKKSHHKKKP